MGQGSFQCSVGSNYSACFCSQRNLGNELEFTGVCIFVQQYVECISDGSFLFGASVMNDLFDFVAVFSYSVLGHGQLVKSQNKEKNGHVK
jgi:hypothetical protein